MKNKIILADVQNEERPYLEIPLGLLSIGSFLENKKYDVKIVKINMGNPDKINKYLDKGVACVGFGVRTDQVEVALIVSKHIKRINKDIKIIWGGVHVNLYPKQVLENDNIDIVVYGDGEYTLFEVAKAISKNKTLRKIAGCGYKEKNKLFFNEKRGFTNISKLPKIDYSIIEELETYIEDSKSADAIMKNTAFLPILSGVGCPFNCSFCYNTTQRGRMFKRDVNVMLDEISELQKRYNLNFFRIRDELFFYDKNKAEEFIKEKKKRGLKFMWDSSFHVNLLKNDIIYSDEFISDLKKEGFVYTGVGVESGSIEQLKRYRKNITPWEVVKVAKRLSKLKLLSTYAFMVGAPYETYNDIIDTVRLIYKIKSIAPDYVYVTGPLSLFRPYPGADLYQEAIKMGYKEKEKLEDWKNLSKFTGYSTYKDFPYLKTDLSKIYNVFYYLKLIKGLFNVKNKNVLNLLRKEIIYKILTNASIVNIVGLTIKIFIENKLVDKLVVRKILGRSLILER